MPDARLAAQQATVELSLRVRNGNVSGESSVAVVGKFGGIRKFTLDRMTAQAIEVDASTGEWEEVALLPAVRSLKRTDWGYAGSGVTSEGVVAIGGFVSEQTGGHAVLFDSDGAPRQGIATLEDLVLPYYEDGVVVRPNGASGAGEGGTDVTTEAGIQTYDGFAGSLVQIGPIGAEPRVLAPRPDRAENPLYGIGGNHAFANGTTAGFAYYVSADLSQYAETGCAEEAHAFTYHLLWAPEANDWSTCASSIEIFAGRDGFNVAVGRHADVEPGSLSIVRLTLSLTEESTVELGQDELGGQSWGVQLLEEAEDGLLLGVLRSAAASRLVEIAVDGSHQVEDLLACGGSGCPGVVETKINGLAELADGRRLVSVAATYDPAEVDCEFHPALVPGAEDDELRTDLIVYEWLRSAEGG